MADDAPHSDRYRLPALTGRVVSRLMAIATVVLATAGWFAYVAGWLSPGLLTQARMIDIFQQANGLHPGFRRNHAKGVCVTGSFQSNGEGARLSRAGVLAPGRTPVVGRFSLGGGNPQMADSASAVLAMALSLRPPGGEEWRMAMIDLPVFIFRDVQGFRDQLLASTPDPATGQPDPARMAAFAAAHPETVRAMQIIKSSDRPSGFATATYHGLNAFRFVAAGGVTTPVRWSMEPTEPPVPAAAGQDKTQDKSYLFDDLLARLARGPLQWHLVVTLGQPGDATDDPTVPWPADRRRVDVGTLTIDHADTEAPGNCRDMVFDPLILPRGIEPSDDPMLSARSATYSESLRRRDGEPKTPSAVQVRPAAEARSP